MEYKKLKEALIKEHKENLKSASDKLKDVESLAYCVRWELNKSKSYAGTFKEQREKALHRLKVKYDKRLKLKMDQLKAISEAQKLPNPLKVMIEWKKSYMWGLNPRASDNYGNDSGSIGGCGYDKLSTAFARILNQHLYLIKLMCDKKENALNDPELKDLDNNNLHRKVLGYGSGYGIIPSFEGGVGVNSLISILEGLGLKVDSMSSPSSNCFFIFFNSEEVLKC